MPIAIRPGTIREYVLERERGKTDATVFLYATPSIEDDEAILSLQDKEGLAIVHAYLRRLFKGAKPGTWKDEGGRDVMDDAPPVDDLIGMLPREDRVELVEGMQKGLERGDVEKPALSASQSTET